MISLPTVSLYAYATVFHKATFQALMRCAKHVNFAKIIVFTDKPDEFVSFDHDIQHVLVEHYGAGSPEVNTNLRNGADKANVWIVTELPKYADMFTEHQLGIQWDSWVVNPDAWRPEFLDYDYIGAQWADGTVGNNGFWLTSQKLLRSMAALKLPPIPQACHPSDIRLSYTFCPRDGRMTYLRWPEGHDGYRSLLEAAGCKWAPKEIADKFSVENREYVDSFGFHGVKTMASVVRQGLLV